jgi:hypothetical protein
MKRETRTSSFLKKRSKRLLFLRRSHLSGHGLHLSAGTRSKSLLVLFFRREQASLSLNGKGTPWHRLSPFFAPHPCRPAAFMWALPPRLRIWPGRMRCATRFFAWNRGFS